MFLGEAKVLEGPALGLLPGEGRSREGGGGGGAEPPSSTACCLCRRCKVGLAQAVPEREDEDAETRTGGVWQARGSAGLTCTPTTAAAEAAPAAAAAAADRPLSTVTVDYIARNRRG